MLKARITFERILVGTGRNLVFQFSHVAFDAAKELRCAKTFLENVSPFVEIGNLFEVADLKTAASRYRAGINFRDRANHVEERGLAGAVGANEADFFCRIYLEGNVSKYGL